MRLNAACPRATLKRLWGSWNGPSMSWLIKGGNIMHELTKLIKDDMRPALGVTEPGAIAYAVSKARSYLTGELKEVRLY